MWNWKHAASSMTLSVTLTLLVTACAATTSPPIPITAAGNNKVVSCRSVRHVTFAAPAYTGEPDPANEIDTPETIDQVRGNNAVIAKNCGK